MTIKVYLFIRKIHCRWKDHMRSRRFRLFRMVKELVADIIQSSHCARHDDGECLKEKQQNGKQILLSVVTTILVINYNNNPPSIYIYIKWRQTATHEKAVHVEIEHNGDEQCRAALSASEKATNANKLTK